MLYKRILLNVLMVAFLLGCVGTRLFAEDKKEDNTKKGTIIGVVTAKKENFIEVKADGEEKARRYVPEWKGGSPAKGGGLDKTMLQTIRKTPVGARVRLEWKFEERPRVIKLEVLKKPTEKKSEDK